MASARSGLIKFKLSPRAGETLERLIARYTISGLAIRFDSNVSTIERLRFGGTADERTVDRFEAMILAEAA